MRPELPSLASLIFFDIEFWLFTAPIALGLAVLAWHGPKWLGRFRWVALAVAVVIATPLSLGAMYRVSKFLLLERTLYHDEIVAGQSLYAGSRIRFRGYEHTYIDQIELPRVTKLSGIPFTGTVFFRGGGDTPGRWSGTLASDHTIDGWPCARGNIVTQGGRRLLTCRLASAHVFFDFELPAGTRVDWNWPEHGIDTWSLNLPPNKGLAIKALSTTAPGGAALRVTGDGHLRDINLNAGQTIVVRGVPLRGRSVMVEDTIAGEIAEPFVVAGEQRPAGTRVNIDLADTGWSCQGGTIRLPYERSLWSCQLTSAHPFFDYDLPAGTWVAKYDKDATWFAYPPDKAVVIKALSTTAPGGTILKVTSDGSLTNISLRDGQAMMIRGVPLKGEIKVYGTIYGDTAESFVVAGEQQPVDTPVQIDLVTGDVSLNRPDCVCPK